MVLFLRFCCGRRPGLKGSLKKKEIDKTIDCSICLQNSNIAPNMTKQAFLPAKTLPCGHTFHRPCVERWMREKPSCPICRQHPSRISWLYNFR